MILRNNLTVIVFAIPIHMERKKNGQECDRLYKYNETPRIEYCPGELWITAHNVSAVVNLDKPHFNDNIKAT